MSISYSAFPPRFAKLVGAQITTLTPRRCTPVKNSGLEPQRVHFSDFSPLSLEKEKVNIFQLELPLHWFEDFCKTYISKNFMANHWGTHSIIKSILANAFFCGKSLIICLKTLIFQRWLELSELKSKWVNLSSVNSYTGAIHLIICQQILLNLILEFAKWWSEPSFFEVFNHCPSPASPASKWLSKQCSSQFPLQPNQGKSTKEGPSKWNQAWQKQSSLHSILYINEVL